MNIFVFGSNLAGRHGKGAALYARTHHNAQYGVGIGLTGSAYAIPTKDHKLKTLPLPTIQSYVDQFLAFAKNSPHLTFTLTPIGCGLAGYRYPDIAPMFLDSPPNVIVPEEFLQVIRTLKSKDKLRM